MSILSKSRRLKQRLGNAKRRAANCMRAASPSLSGNMAGQQRHDMNEFEKERVKVVSGNSWDEFRREIAKEFCENPIGFLRSPTISRTLHPNGIEQALLRFNDMKTRDFDRENIIPFLYDVPFGDPYLCDFFPLASPNTINKGYHLSLMKRHLDVFVDDLDFIMDFGGGYGNFCRIAHILGFSGRFVIVDFPDMHIIQRDYLNHSLPKTSSHRIEYVSVSDAVSCAIPEDRTLFVATHSLNETPLDARYEIEEFLYSFRHLLIAYNRSWEGIDNRAWASKLAKRLDYRFETRNFQDIDQRFFYLVGNSRWKGELP